MGERRSQDPNKKLIIEEDDPGKAHIVKALENILFKSKFSFAY